MTPRHQLVTGYLSHIYTYTRTHKSVAAHTVLLTVFVDLSNLRPLRPPDRRLKGVRWHCSSETSEAAGMRNSGTTVVQPRHTRTNSGFCVISKRHKTGCGVQTRPSVSLQITLLSTSDHVTALCLFTLQRGRPHTRLSSRRAIPRGLSRVQTEDPACFSTLCALHPPIHPPNHVRDVTLHKKRRQIPSQLVLWQVAETQTYVTFVLHY